ncbi:MAG: bifunctional diaminohydroxyphosphoribosylaminopyrimidine deaminase/5-amino-6-(5-phosphoribosylamino)uracil reductase RibD [Prevotellaceae bacterium]|jgi:diaminohydroxyphosphoribosylaminopyrimidine deaminase/5-amino-6-(5-phosphoribosylamino)uracil reductase|nr:bifunctional diaminohydroxyphosphoribosylaminopyrimidine deaminase/5-amino-6-(5-phosphoribosylamino)uracil reductase RibD [Prevotellaceae bacterium]
MEEKFMHRCFELAGRGLGNVAPNPMVGAVIVHNGKIIGEGYHRKYGEPHAEVNAIASVRNPELLKKSALYVNLEPCSHYGKTPPCAQLIIEKQIPKVVIANRDPFPEVCGRGINMLKKAGIEVVEDFLTEKGWELNRRFFTFYTKKRPYVILKWAQTANGFMDVARENAETPPLRISNKITSMPVHKLRAEESAVLVGTKTALSDNPELTVRDWYGKNPVRVLIDRKLEIPQNYRICNKKAPTVIFTEKAPESVSSSHIEYVEVPFNGPGETLSLKVILEKLYEKKLQSLIVEGGSRLLNSFIRSGCWDEMRVETAMELTVPNGIPAPQISGKCVRIEMIENHIIERFGH